jgi:uncharacterized protein (TIGR02270 family)
LQSNRSNGLIASAIMSGVQVLPHVLQQHVAEAASAYDMRSALRAAPHVGVREIRWCDDRLAAHLDGLSIADEQAWPFVEAALEAASPGAVFVVAIRAIEARQPDRLDRLFAFAEAIPETRPGLVSAFGWLERKQLQGIVASLLDAREPFRRTVGIAACSLHRVDPGLMPARRIFDVSPSVRARALRTAGEIGCQEVDSACTAALLDDDPECRDWAARSSVLLGNRGTSLQVLTDTGLAAGPHRLRSFRLVLQAMSAKAAHGVLQELAKDPAQLRWLIQGSGIAGDPKYVPWLIGHMAHEKTARLAAEAFSLITGVDLSASDFERQTPENVESGPNDDPDDPNVDMDPDEGLPWPDPQKIEAWWAANGSRFPPGTRYFMGAPVTREHCIDVLKNGYQRQRILAAQYLCLLNPGTPLFNTSAPAWRQQKLLAGMT